MDRALFSTDNTPAALSFNAPHLCHGPWISVAHAIAVRYLVKTVSGGFRPYLHGLKKDIESGIAGHWYMLLLVSDSIRDRHCSLKVDSMEWSVNASR